MCESVPGFPPAALKPASLQRTVLLLAMTKPARLYVSRPILAEYGNVLNRPELRIRKGLRQELLQLIKKHSYTVVPVRRLEVTSDPDDNIFLECAEAARAEYIVTGSRALCRSAGSAAPPKARVVPQPGRRACTRMDVRRASAEIPSAGSGQALRWESSAKPRTPLPQDDSGKG